METWKTFASRLVTKFPLQKQFSLWSFKISFWKMDLWNHSRSKQRTDQRVLVITLKFLTLKNCFFHLKKYIPKNFLTFVYLYFMQLFSADPTKKFKKNLNEFLYPWKLKKTGPKVAHHRPKHFFHSPAHSLNMSQDTSVSLSVFETDAEMMNPSPNIFKDFYIGNRRFYRCMVCAVWNFDIFYQLHW